MSWKYYAFVDLTKSDTWSESGIISILEMNLNGVRYMQFIMATDEWSKSDSFLLL
jgi:hypothetical protein